MLDMENKIKCNSAHHQTGQSEVKNSTLHLINKFNDKLYQEWLFIKFTTATVKIRHLGSLVALELESRLKYVLN